MTPLPQFYKETASDYQAKIDAIKQKINLLSALRLASFIGLAYIVYRGFVHFETSLVWIGLACLAIFVWLIRTSLHLKDQRLLNEKLRFVNTNELQILQHNPNGFDGGQSFLTHESYLDDLDIFGQNSVFHLLNRTTTSHGKAQLAGLLSRTLLEKKEIEANQEAIRVLSALVNERQLITANGLLHDESKGNLFSITEWLQTPAVLNHKLWLKIIRWILPLCNTFFFFYYLSTDSLGPLLTGIACSMGITGIYIVYINAQHALLGKKQEILEQYTSILKHFSAVDAGPSVKLQQLQSTAASAHHAMRKLAQLSSFFDQRLNLIVGFFFNMLFVYDIQCVLALEQWKEAYKDQFEGWISCVGEIEVLNSLSTFAFNNPVYTYPVVLPGQLKIEATRMAHPLIPAAESVPNDFSVGKKDTLQLVTGSNMSGKTTFLRTVGVNLLLAQCGLPVCAASFSFTPMEILSSIRVSDSLQEHTSYFMAELKRLEQIVLQLQTGKPALVLIDEILRGTNSDDKTYGSEQFIRKLLHYQCAALFATHDLSLGKLEQEFPGVISNYCFESIIEAGELHFNYQLQHGVAKNRNATFLMKKMNII